MPYLTTVHSGEVELAVYVQPRASRNCLCGIHDGCLKVAVTTPPVDGKANKALISFLAKSLGLAKADIRLKSGQTSRRKIFLVSSITQEELRGHIEPLLQS